MSSGLGDSDLAARSSSQAPSRVAAFFDMDKTLIAENSGSVYMKKRFQDGDIDSWQLARALWDYFQYKAGVLDIQEPATEIFGLGDVGITLRVGKSFFEPEMFLECDLALHGVGPLTGLGFSAALNRNAAGQETLIHLLPLPATGKAKQ